MEIRSPKTAKQEDLVPEKLSTTTTFAVSGMTCAACEAHVDHEINKLPGILKSTTSYAEGKAIVQFDSSKTSVTEIEKAINSTGYKASHHQEN